LEDDEPRLPADYVTREEADTPDDAASVRILAYLMPETSE
jgi:hypothetical protein